jgi:hypothetical protein
MPCVALNLLFSPEKPILPKTIKEASEADFLIVSGETWGQIQSLTLGILADYQELVLQKADIQRLEQCAVFCCHRNMACRSRKIRIFFKIPYIVVSKNRDNVLGIPKLGKLFVESASPVHVEGNISGYQ